jgi:hypothetical protein
MLYSGKPKIGKSTMLSKLPNNLIISLEKNGCDFLEGIDVIDCSQILTATGTQIKDLLTADVKTKALDLAEIIDPNERHKALSLIIRALIKLGKPYKYVSIDTITQADMDAEWAGTEMYMDSLQGKKFNRIEIKNKPSEEWPRIKIDQPDYQSVLEIGQNGWRWPRTVMVNLLNLAVGCSEVCTIFVSHIKDKLVNKGDKGEVFVKDIALTGAIADIYARKVDAVASVYQEDEQLMISFKGNEDRTGGNRGNLGSYEGVFDWEKIFG